jgi:hypothetical protein
MATTTINSTRVNPADASFVLHLLPDAIIEIAPSETPNARAKLRPVSPAARLALMSAAWLMVSFALPT